MTGKQTSDHAAGAASDVMRDGRTADDSKTAAGSALSQAGEGGKDKTTGDAAASAASETLQSEQTGDKSKTAAGSALSQTEND